jgi:hypothetical protein
MILAGGLPLHVERNMVGAVGVSGGSQEEDQAVAETGAGADRLGEGTPSLMGLIVKGGIARTLVLPAAARLPSG